MRRNILISRLELLSKEYNDLSHQLQTLDRPTQYPTQMNPGVAPPLPPANKKNEGVDESVLKKENIQCKKEIRFLKDLLTRCNQQLNKYIQTSSADIPDYDVSQSDQKMTDITRQSVFRLHPLIQAYDEIIGEQEAALKRMTASLEHSLKKMKTLEEENIKYRKIFESLKDEDQYGANPQIVEDAKLLMEERELLLKEVDLLTNAQNQMKVEHEGKIENLREKLRQEKTSCRVLQEKLDKSQKTLDDFQERVKILHAKLENSIAHEDHKKSIAECSKYLDKLKQVYGTQSSTLQKNVTKIREEKSYLEDRLNQSSEKIQGMKKTVIGYNTHLRRNSSILSRQAGVIRSLKTSARNLRTKLQNVSRICSKLLSDRKELLREIQTLKEEAVRCSKMATNKSSNMGRLTLKMKEERLQMVQRIAEIEGKRKGAEENWSKARKDVLRLRELLRSKDEFIQAVLTDMRFGTVQRSS